MSRPERPDLTVVLPVYGCADVLEELHRGLATVLAAQRWAAELVFVDDCSPDAAAQVLSALAARDPRIRVLRQPRRSGQGRATIFGLEVARGEAVAVMDADLQDDPAYLPRLLERLGPSVHAVFAGRRGDYERRGRLLTGRAFKRMLNLITGIPADAGSYVVMDRAMVGRLLGLRARRPHLVSMIACTGLSVTSIPVPRRSRASGASGYGGWRRLWVATAALASLPSWKLRAMRAPRRA
jgi:glycosyltransferase involved in cell wall biosynthesis